MDEYFRHNGIKFKITWMAKSWLVTNLNDSVLADHPNKSIAIEQACKVNDYASQAGISYLEARRNLGYR